MNSYSHANQDEFVLHVLKFKQNGFFLEIGSNHPIQINNTYTMEKDYGWRGVMVEYHEHFLPLYKQHRPNSYYVIEDATKHNYLDTLQKTNAPQNIDYLQIDLEENNGSTLHTLEHLDRTIFNTYTFAVVTFEHDIYRSDVFHTRQKSREIFDRRGYIRLCSDVKFGGCCFEDWYVHPSLVDMAPLQILVNSQELESKEILSKLKSAQCP